MEMSFLGSIGHIITETGLKDLSLLVVFAENTVPHMLSGKAIAEINIIAADIFDINRPDNNAVDIMQTNELTKQAQDRHNRDERSDAIITLDINDQAAHMHANTVAEEAVMKLFDNLMKHAVKLAYVESDKNVRNIIQLLDAKQEDMSKESLKTVNSVH